MAVTAEAVPAADEPKGLAIPIEAVVKAEVVVKEATATTPFEITLLLAPETRHIYVPLLPLQLIDFPAAVAAGPAFTVMA